MSCFPAALCIARRSTSLASHSRSTAVVDEVLAGLKLYFDKSLGNNLLYRFERAQYVDLRKAHTANPKAPKGGDADLEPSSCYGAEHLLRLFGEWQCVREK